jgi:hypothetical protein
MCQNRLVLLLQFPCVFILRQHIRKCQYHSPPAINVFIYLLRNWTDFFIINPTRCTNFTNLFRHETLHVSKSSSVRHQEFIHCTLSNGVCHTGNVHTAFEQDQDGTAVPSWSCSKAVYKLVWFISLLSVQWINPDDGQTNCPKHVEFHDKINLWNWCVYLVLFKDTSRRLQPRKWTADCGHLRNVYDRHACYFVHLLPSIYSDLAV